MISKTIIQRSLYSKPSDYKTLKSDEQKKAKLEEGINKFVNITQVIKEIREPNKTDPLFISKNSYFGPAIPKSAQKLLAAAYIREVGWDAFSENGFYSPGDFIFNKFKNFIYAKDPSVSACLKKSYFQSIFIKGNTLQFAGKSSKYCCTFYGLDFINSVKVNSNTPPDKLEEYKAHFETLKLNVDVARGSCDGLERLGFRTNFVWGKLDTLPSFSVHPTFSIQYNQSNKIYNFIYDEYIIGYVYESYHNQFKMIAYNLLIQAIVDNRDTRRENRPSAPSPINMSWLF